MSRVKEDLNKTIKEALGKVKLVIYNSMMPNTRASDKDPNSLFEHYKEELYFNIRETISKELEDYELVKIKFKNGDDVYFNNSENSSKGKVTGHKLSPNGLLYFVTWSDFLERQHYEIELSHTKVII